MQISQLLTPNEQDILSVLLEDKKLVYGLEIFDRINDKRTKWKVNKIGYGSFYAALKKLEREKFIECSTLEDKRKKHYKITADGKTILDINKTYLDYSYPGLKNNLPQQQI